jgi:hypothetical protein
VRISQSSASSYVVKIRRIALENPVSEDGAMMLKLSEFMH